MLGCGPKSDKLKKVQSELSFFLFEVRIQYFLYSKFSSPTRKKSLPLKVPIPTYNTDLT